jgi:hypothetical protein
VSCERGVYCAQAPENESKIINTMLPVITRHFLLLKNVSALILNSFS